jgi:hypothetical protein
MNGEPDDSNIRGEIERMHRVADMMCAGHSLLSDRFARRALCLDVGVMLVSTWMAALAFVDPAVAPLLTPMRIDPRLWLGTMALLAFATSLFQMRVNWKGSADAHRKSSQVYADVKQQCGLILQSRSYVDRKACDRLIYQYGLADTLGCSIAERHFAGVMKHYKTKKALVHHLEGHPTASILLTRVRWWVRDNLRRELAAEDSAKN